MIGTQDLIFAVGSVVFILALWPSLVGEHKPSITSSVMTGLVLTVYSGVYISLHFWFSFATTLILAFEWFILAIQEWRKEH